jgi:rubrerythrin
MSSESSEGSGAALNTAASVISYVSRIEQESSGFYEKWAPESEEFMESFLSFAGENKKHEKNVKRAYYGVVSDALETNFCFQGLRADVLWPAVPQGATSEEVLKASFNHEKSVLAFYNKAAETSRALLADVSRAMGRVAKMRKARVERIQALLEGI